MASFALDLECKRGYFGKGLTHMANYKIICSNEEALVSDDLIKKSDAEINKTIPSAAAGMVIYTARDIK